MSSQVGLDVPVSRRGTGRGPRLSVSMDSDADIPQEFLPFRDNNSSRQNMLSSLSGFYLMLITLMGIVFPLCVYISEQSKDGAAFMQVYHILIFTGGIIFVLYMTVYTRSQKVSARKQGYVPPVPKVYVVEPLEDQNLHKTYNVSRDMDDEQNQGMGDYDFPFSYHGEGVNFYLRLGAIGFGIAFLALDGFQVSLFANKEAWDCLGTLYLIVHILRLCFTSVQTFFIFKQHRLVVNFHKPLVRFGLLHMVATNLCVWAIIVVVESAESFLEHHPPTDPGLPNISTPLPVKQHWANEAEVIPEQSSSSIISCMEEFGGLAFSVSSYLFPCAIEFSLIAAAIFYRMYTCVGIKFDREESTQERLANSVMSSITGECHKSHSGLFSGLFLLTAIVIGVLFFIFYLDKGDILKYETDVYIFYINDFVVHGLSILALMAAFIKTSQLTFIGHLETEFDQNLLLIALGGHYAYFIFQVVPSVGGLGNYEGIILQGARFQIAQSFLTLVQATIQTAFIIDGLRRRSTKKDHIRFKPGRSVITFLILTNLCMWVINTFELKEMDLSPLHLDYFGDQAWKVIVNASLPLAIFFRFHSSVCLAEIWNTAYKMEATYKEHRQVEESPEVFSRDL